MHSIAAAFRKHRLYPEFRRVQERLNRHQFVCWIAGGAVRDFLLDRDFEDLDLVTDATTESLKRIFPEALGVGEKFGVFKIILADGGALDITTFRQESDYVDGRRPSVVEAATPPKDAQRRDFTVNALYWDDLNQRLVDSVQGLDDLHRRRLVAVGDAEVRFAEDHLRVLRLVRFSAQLGFEIQPDTERAARRSVDLLSKISGERIWAEFKKIRRAQAWNDGLSLPLFHLILRQIFSGPLHIGKIIEVPVEDHGLHLFYVLSSLERPSVDLHKILAERLHLSKNEQQTFQLFVRARTELVEITAEKLSFEIDQKKTLIPVLRYLTSQGVVKEELFQKALTILELYPMTFIQAEEIKDWVPAPKIGKALKEVRRLQLEGLVKTKDEAVIAIKNWLVQPDQRAP